MSFTSQYLERYAEPECQMKWPLPAARTWSAAVCVPVLRESALLENLLQSLATAAKSANARALAILVVNCAEASASDVVDDNQALLTALCGQTNGEPFYFVPYGDGLDLLIVDRTSAGRRFPPKLGVGLARKIGCDLAVALYASGRLESDMIRTTDGDARVDEAYFLNSPPGELKLGIGRPENRVEVFPFRHGVGTAPIPEALALYEIFLRYYVHGLTFAGSPYAFPTIGSTLSFSIGAYELVRGFPRREAGEDFHLLSKLSQVSRVLLRKSGLVTLQARESDRVPFGTGAAMARIGAQLKAGKRYRVYDPMHFCRLKEWLAAVESWVGHRDLNELRKSITDEKLAKALTELKTWEALDIARKTRPQETSLRQHVHTWFDSLKTLRLIHLMEQNSGRQEWQQAISGFRRLAPEFGYPEVVSTPHEVLAALRKLDAQGKEELKPEATT